MKVSFQADPLKKYIRVPVNQLIDACGILPMWATAIDYAHKPLLEALKEQYGFPMPKLTKGTVTEDGIFQYPEDPDQYPLIKIQRGKETFYQYEHSIVAIIDKDGNSYVTRMD